MPISTTYPGVYIEEIPSGVRTITGVSTSVAAFVGAAKRGPINKATRVFGFADYERAFGGLSSDSEMSYAVRQFFLNGGSDAYIVRLAKDTVAASRSLHDANDKNVLEVIALDEGTSGNNIEVRVDHETSEPQANTFNLVLDYVSPDNPVENATERFEDLSMNSTHARYVVSVVNDASRLVRIEPGKGTLLSGKLEDSSGALLDVAAQLGSGSKSMGIVVNGGTAVSLSLDPAADAPGDDPVAKLEALCRKIQAHVRDVAAGNAALANFRCKRVGSRIKMVSGVGGANSSVVVNADSTSANDAASRLKLLTAQGAVATGTATGRPAPIPDPGKLTSGAFATSELTALPDANNTNLRIQVDGYGPDLVELASVPASGTDIDARLNDLAPRLETAVQRLKPSNPAYKNFDVAVDATNDKLVLSSGTRGSGSSVVVQEAPAKDIAQELHLLTGTTSTPGSDVFLEGGTESAFGPADAYNLFIGSRSARKGIYALEAVDLFNLLCLPGVSDPGILTDAVSYCEERRAFLIIDPPASQNLPAEMASAASGTAFPESNHAAVYYPWIRIADPLQNGRPRLCPPSGTIAGVYAQTDARRGVWKAPAGTEATLTGVQGVAYPLTDRENGMLNPLGVNCVRVLPVFGAVSWGARTLQGADLAASEWKYVPIRRLALYIEETLYRNTKWVVFEPNGEPLWSQIRLNIGAFMNDLFRQGAFQGKTPREAYFVKCDKETTTQNDINQGRVNIVVGFAPLKPAEFVIIQLQQIAGQIQA